MPQADEKMQKHLGETGEFSVYVINQKGLTSEEKGHTLNLV